MKGAPPTTFVLLDDGSGPVQPCALYHDLVEEVVAWHPEEVEAALDVIATARRRGLHAAGFFAYELGYVFEPRLQPLLPPERTQPLLWFGLFETRRDLPSRDLPRLLGGEEGYSVESVRPSLDRAGYLCDLARIRDWIAAGDVYQVNHTFQLAFRWSGDPLALYLDLRRKQRAGHAALVRTRDVSVLSLSPELFFETCGRFVRTRPMKGTAPRANFPGDDPGLRQALRSDPKSRAENLMIVDLLRNDLSRVSKIGSVRVPELFRVDSYPTLHQMVSTVEAELLEDIGPGDLIRRLFPCGSVTGAPKIRAMEIIRELEPAPRGVYCGAVGAFDAEGGAHFNVAIRTAVLRADGRGTLGIGSGVVHDSCPEAEYDECLLKARFLTDPPPGYRLFESLLWEGSRGYILLDRHLDRLRASADSLGFPFDGSETKAVLSDAVAGLSAAETRRVRLVLDRDGGLSAEALPFTPPGDDTVWHFALSDRHSDSGDRLLYHKTTQRAFYEGELARWRESHGVEEVVFVNEHGELTEGARTNLFLEIEGELLTPARRCGLLDGTLRREMLEAGRPRPAREAVLLPADLDRAEAVFLGNSLRGLVRAVRVSQDRGVPVVTTGDARS